MSEINNSIFEKIKFLSKLNEEIKKNIKNLYVLNVNEMNVILLTNEGKVYCCGYNSWGVLGFGHDNNVKEFSIIEVLSNKQIIDFKNSLYHTIARTSDGKLYCWGCNLCLGNGREDLKISKPKLNKNLINENIIDMYCGGGHTLVLTSNYEVYAWGLNNWGQIGNRRDGWNEVLIPFKLNEFNGEKVKEISCGSNHSMALTESGCIYSWGSNERGQLGLNNGNRKQNKPELIQIEVKFKKISCGQYHSLLLSREGDIHVFGCNKYRQLGLKTNEEKQLTPIKLNHSEKFIEIASHSHYNISAAISRNGLYYVWGYCGEEVTISEPKETEFESFNELFVHYLGITYKTLDFSHQNEFLFEKLKFK